MYRHFFFLLIIICSLACQPDRKIDHSEFKTHESLVVTEVARSPDIIQPVEIEQDHFGNLWAVELTGYMRDIEANGEDIPDGRIVMLQDKDGDGSYETRNIILDGLLNPRSICLAYGGLLFTDGIQLKYASLNRSKLGPIEIVDSTYVIGGNIEHQPNGLLYGIDNWIYSANTTAKYKRQNSKWVKEPTLFRGQWGISQTKDGRLIYNNNSIPIAGEACLPNTISNPHFKFDLLGVQPLTNNRFVYPSKATAVNRGYQEGVLDSTGKLTAYTSACSPFILESNTLGEQFTSNIFVCAPEINMVTRYTPLPSSHRYLHSKENAVLVESNKEIFRPVSMTLGIDGKLYIVDMRKGVIQHRAYMTDYLRKLILKKKLDQITNRGLILTLTHADSTYTIPKFDNEIRSLISMLESPNLSIRIQAQKLIMNLPSTKELQSILLSTIVNPALHFSPLHAYYILLDHYNLSSVDLIPILQNTSNLDVIKQVLKNATSPPDRQFKNLYKQVINDDTKSNQIASCVIASKFIKLMDDWIKLAIKHNNNPLMQEALLARIPGNYNAYRLRLMETDPTNSILPMLQSCIINEAKSRTYLPKLQTITYDDDRTNGLNKFKLYCAPCHGIDGLGQKLMAPSLAESLILRSPEHKVAEVILNGYSKSEEFNAAMPAYKDNPSLSDTDILDIIKYLKSTWGINSKSMDIREVTKLRNKGNI